MNRVFPNPYFHIATEQELAASLRSLGEVRPAQVPWELAFGDRLTGTFGPLFLALPIGLIALRRREGRLLWAAAFFARPALVHQHRRALLDARRGARSHHARHGAGASGGVGRHRDPGRPLLASRAGCLGDPLQFPPPRIPPRRGRRRRVGGRLPPARRFEEYNVARMVQRCSTRRIPAPWRSSSVANAYLDR